jgi:Bax protein
LDSLSKVIPVTDTLVVPILYDTLLIDSHWSVDEKKQQFINQVLPAILIVQFNEQLKYEKITSILDKLKNNKQLSEREQYYIDSLVIKYDVDSVQNLPERVKLHPVSLVLAQAALESGWGQSRFAVEGNNLFGITSPTKRNSLSVKGKRRSYMQKYESVEESVKHYYFTIGNNEVYHNFRKKRAEGANVYQLIDELDNYSIKGVKYTDMLKDILFINDLEKYDKYVIDNKYITDKTTFKYLIKKYIQRFLTK